MSDSLYDEQLSAAKFRAERDMARQEVKELREELDAASKDAAERSKTLEAARWVRDHGGLAHIVDIVSDFRAVVERIGVEWSESELHAIMGVLDSRLMPEGYEWSDGFAGAVDFFEAMHDLLYTIDGEEHTGPEMVRDVMARLMPKLRDRLRDTTMNACDLLPEEDREALRWVRERGGLDYVKSEWRSRVPHDRYEARRQRLLGHIAECETALGRRRVRIEELGHRVSDLTNENAELRRRVSVLAADGEPLREGETVYLTDSPTAFVVDDIMTREDGATVVHLKDGAWNLPQYLTHKRPVLDACGVPIRKGDTVWCVATDDELTDMSIIRACWSKMREKLIVKSFITDAHGDKWVDFEETSPYVKACYLTHAKPEQDSWERIEEDKDLNPFDYCKKVGHKLWTFDNAEEFKASDLVRRAKKLAGVE